MSDGVKLFAGLVGEGRKRWVDAVGLGWLELMHVFMFIIRSASAILIVSRSSRIYHTLLLPEQHPINPVSSYHVTDPAVPVPIRS